MALADLLPSGPDAPRYVKASMVARLLGVSLTTLYSWSDAGDFPAYKRLGPRTHVYDLAELREALSRRDYATTTSAKE